MKGTKLAILIFISAIVVMIGFLYVLYPGILPSWSEADLHSNLQWVLKALLFSIASLFTLVGFKHQDRNKVILKNWKLPDLKTLKFKKPFFEWHYKGITLRQVALLGALFFGGVLIFGLGGGNFSVAMHYVSTPLGAIAAYLMVVRSQDKGVIRSVFAIVFFLAAAVWLIGLLGNWYGFRILYVFDGENAFIVPALVWYFMELKNFED